MKKRILAALLAICLVFSTGVIAFAEGETVAPVLKFDENGEFKILHLCDCQDGYPADERMFEYINYVLEVYDPDIVVLGGDNTVGEGETKQLAIDELCKPFVESETYFTMVFGNHDYQQGYTNDELFEMYQKAGGDYFLAYDAVPELHGTATHNLPVYSNDGSKVKFNLWMFDSGSYVDGGYDCVRKDQIDWYLETSNKLKAEAGALVPSMAFQHIIVGDVYDALFVESPINLGVLTANYNGKYYTYLPKLHNFSGFLVEPPCPGVDNEGQLEAMAKQGDVLAIFSGHDHVNDFETEYKGVDIVNTPSPTYNSYSSIVNKGSRLITINEESPYTYTSEVITYNNLVIENPELAEVFDLSVSTAKLYNFLGNLALVLTKFCGIFSGMIF
ncbi:MAG: metallophosphoesterase [Clostridia bacterium]|nr:metallophosphoesterase [Clostridia bacterium]